MLGQLGELSTSVLRRKVTFLLKIPATERHNPWHHRSGTKSSRAIISTLNSHSSLTSGSDLGPWSTWESMNSCYRKKPRYAKHSTRLTECTDYRELEWCRSGAPKQSAVYRPSLSLVHHPCDYQGHSFLKCTDSEIPPTQRLRTLLNIIWSLNRDFL